MLSGRVAMKPLVIVRGGGEVASGVIHTLHLVGYDVLVLETHKPLTLRREVAFAEAVYCFEKTVERLTAFLAHDYKEADKLLRKGKIAVLVDPLAKYAQKFRPHIVVDTLGNFHEQGLPFISGLFTIGLGEGFSAGVNVDVAIETYPGHHLGRIVQKGRTFSKIPFDRKKYMKGIIFAEQDGIFQGKISIGNSVKMGETLGAIKTIEGKTLEVKAPFAGILRGILHDDIEISKNFPLAEVAGSDEGRHCYTISDRARCVAGSVLTAILIWQRDKKWRF